MSSDISEIWFWQNYIVDTILTNPTELHNQVCITYILWDNLHNCDDQLWNMEGMLTYLVPTWNQRFESLFLAYLLLSLSNDLLFFYKKLQYTIRRWNMSGYKEGFSPEVWSLNEVTFNKEKRWWAIREDFPNLDAGAFFFCYVI